MKRFAALVLAAGAITLAACGGVSEVVAPVTPTATPIQFPSASSLDQQKNDIVNEAVRFAAAGCPGLDERLSGPPTRVLAALTNSSYAGGLINREADFGQLGPSGAGAVTVWVAAVEGSSVPIIGDDPWDGSNVRAYIFVIDAFNPELTGCVLRDAPTLLKYSSSRVPIPGGGGFEYVVLLEAQ